MNGLVGCFGLIGIAIFIILLGLWSRRSRQGVGKFYEKYSLSLTADPPANVRELIGAQNLVCRRGTIKPASGGEIEFFWWEWFTSSSLVINGAPQTTISCFLAVSFAPNAVSDDFKNIARQANEESNAFSLKNALTLNTTTPTGIETLPDGTFVIFWNVLQRPQIMEDKIDWLKKNLSAGKPEPTCTGDFIVVEAEIDLTLMMMQPSGDHVPTSIMSYTYFFLVPGSFAEHLLENTTREMDNIYRDHRIAMQEKEPNDPNYIAVVGVRPTIMSASERADQPWLTAKIPVWEESVCISPKEDGVFKLSPGFFTGAIGFRKVT